MVIYEIIVFSRQIWQNEQKTARPALCGGYSTSADGCLPTTSPTVPIPTAVPAAAWRSLFGAVCKYFALYEPLRQPSIRKFILFYFILNLFLDPPEYASKSTIHQAGELPGSASATAFRRSPKYNRRFQIISETVTWQSQVSWSQYCPFSSGTFETWQFNLYLYYFRMRNHFLKSISPKWMSLCSLWCNLFGISIVSWNWKIIRPRTASWISLLCWNKVFVDSKALEINF